MMRSISKIAAVVGLAAMLGGLPFCASAEEAAPAMQEQGTTPAPAGNAAPATTEAPAAAEAPAKSEAPAAAQGTVARAQFTTGVKNHEPVDDVTTLPLTDNKVYFFTELKGMKGQTVTHRWEHNGKVMAEVKFHVRGPRWRVWSSKNLVDGWAGKWTASVVDAQGQVLESRSFDYGK